LLSCGRLSIGLPAVFALEEWRLPTATQDSILPHRPVSFCSAVYQGRKWRRENPYPAQGSWAI